MPIWETPQSWTEEFLRSQKFNKEVRDKQEFLFKRPRAIVNVSGSGTLAIPTAGWDYIDTLNLAATLETSGRPLVVTLSLSILRSGAADANAATYFDIEVLGNGHASSNGGVPKNKGAFYLNQYKASQRTAVSAIFVIDWLTEAGLYTLKPKWLSNTASMTCPTNNAPIELLVEEI